MQPGQLRQLPEGTTALAVWNIPRHCTQEELLKEWEHFVGHFNFFYLPVRAGHAFHNGCAFINFTSPAVALEFRQQKQRTFLPRHGRGKHLDVAAASAVVAAAASLQGLEMTLRQLSRGLNIPQAIMKFRLLVPTVPTLALTLETDHVTLTAFQVRFAMMSGEVLTTLELPCCTRLDELQMLAAGAAGPRFCNVAVMLPDGELLRNLPKDLSLKTLMELNARNHVAA